MPETRSWREYGVFDSEGELDLIKESLKAAQSYYEPSEGDVIKVRIVTRTDTEWAAF
jgi:hypothetical protein